IVLPTLRHWRTQPLLVASLGWFAVNAVASFASTRALGVGGHMGPHVWFGPVLLRLVTIQELVPFWLLLPLPFGVVHLRGRDRAGLVVVGVGIVAGLVVLSVSPAGSDDPTRSYMEYFRYGTWTLPWIVLIAAEGMDAGVAFVARFAPDGPERAQRAATAAAVTIIAVCMATPLVFHG